MQRKREGLEAQEREKVGRYIAGIRTALQGMVVKELPDNIGGLYNGSSVVMAAETLRVHSSIEDTVAQATETGEHERYHQQHKHMEAMQMGASAHGDAVVTIGNEAFTDTRMVEALTVHDTGAEFVSSEYVAHERAVSAALIRANLGWSDVRNAVNVRKDYGELDDQSRGLTEPDLALSA